MENHPLTTEEPLSHPELLREINKVDPRDKEVPPAVIVHYENPNQIIPPLTQQTLLDP
ncbi:hypothetical protein CU098_003312, partial [Rhizopus stolonifer]